MYISLRNLRPLFAGLAFMGPALALAWPGSPYGYGPQYYNQGPMPYGSWGAPAPADNALPAMAPGYPESLGQSGLPTGPFPAPGMDPFSPGFGQPPAMPDFPEPRSFSGPGGSGFQPPGMQHFPAPPSFSAPDRSGFARSSGRLRFTQSVTEEGYVLEIPLEGIKAEEIQVDLDGRSIRLSRDASAKKSREETLDDGRGYMRSYSYSSGRSSRRIPLPQDADGGAMRREDSAEKVRVIIPRRQG